MIVLSKEAVRRRSGAIFRLGSCDAADLARYVELLNEQPNQRALIECLFDLCVADEDHLTDMETLRERLQLARSGVLLRMRPLLDQGYLKTSLQQVHTGVRSTNVYELQKPPSASLPASSTRQADVRHNANAFSPLTEQPRLDLAPQQVEQALQLFYDENHPPVWKGERFVVFSLISGLRLGRKGEERVRKETRVHMGPRWFDVTIRALDSSMIPSVIDLRVLIVVCTMIREFLRNAAVPPDSKKGFALDMNNICHALGLEPYASNKRHLLEQLRRWRDSGFKVTQAMNGALQWAKGIELEQEFSIISRINTVRFVGKEGGSPEIIQVYLDPCVLEALCDMDRNFIVHPEILHDRKPKPFMHLYYYWCRRVVQLSAEGKFYSLEHLNRELQPEKDLRRFRADTLEIMEERELKHIPPHYPSRLLLSNQEQLIQRARLSIPKARRGKGLMIARIPGHILRYSNDEMGFWVDPDCPLIGEANRKRIAARNKAVTHGDEDL